MISYHNHSTWSDGRGAPEGLAAAAAAAGLEEFGVSDHLALIPDGRVPGWAMPPRRLEEYLAALHELRACSAVPLRVGVEADFFPETCSRLAGLLDRHPFDFVIGAVHFVGDFPVDTAREQWASLSPARLGELWDRYWNLVGKMAATRRFDIAAHLDLPKRFGSPPAGPVSPAALRALDALATSGMAIELNTAGWSCAAGECYPSPPLLAEARQRGIPLVISADAHQPDHVARDFSRARELARESGYAALVRFEGRRAHSFPL